METCNPIRDDIQIAYGENHTFAMSFDTARNLIDAKCTFTIRRNNSDPDEIYRDQQPIQNNNCSITLTPDQCRAIGEGKFWYDIWIVDGPRYEKPLVMGVITIPYLSTRAQL